MKITSIGEILIDLTQTGCAEGGDPCFAAHPGGAPANAAVAASRLGAESSFVGCVGNDSFGWQLKDTLEKCGIGTDGLQMTDKASTTIAVVTVDQNGERGFSFLRKPGADQLIDRNLAAATVKDAGILHFGSVSLTEEPCRSTVIAAVTSAKKNGSLISYDPNYRASLWVSAEEAQKHIREVLPLCDIVKMSDEETELMTGSSDPEKAAERLVEQGVSIVIITLGSEGALWYHQGQCGIVPGFKSDVADTNGAGDTFWGAFLSCIAKHEGIEGLSPEDIERYVRFANMAASLSVRKHGAIPSMPYLQEVEEALRNEQG